MTATFAQYPIMSGTYTSVAQELTLIAAEGISNNVEVPSGSHHIQVAVDGYYRVGANLQITGKVGSQSLFYIKQNTNVVNQYFVDVLGNMMVAFETVIYASSGDGIFLYLTVSTGGAVILNGDNLLYPSALFAYLID